MNNSLTSGNSFFLLNTKMNLVSTDYSYGPPTMSGKYFRTSVRRRERLLPAEQRLRHLRRSVANWQSFFDPSTGYIVGYVYSETRPDGTTSGFTLTDSLAVTNTSYALTQAAAPPASSSGGGLTNLEIAIIAIVVLIVIIVVIYAVVSAARRRIGSSPSTRPEGA